MYGSKYINTFEKWTLLPPPPQSLQKFSQQKFIQGMYCPRFQDDINQFFEQFQGAGDVFKEDIFKLYAQYI